MTCLLNSNRLKVQDFEGRVIFDPLTLTLSPTQGVVERENEDQSI